MRRTAGRLILHVDLDAFNAAVQQRGHPEWQGRAVVVGAEPGRRGVVATCSFEARRYGLPSAKAVSEARKSMRGSKKTSFPVDVTGHEALRETLRWTAQEVGYLARHRGRKGSEVTLKDRFHPFATHTH